MKASGRYLNIVLFTIFGLGVYQIASWLWPLLPKLAWLSITLGIVAVAQEFAIHFLGRYHDRTASELNHKVDELSKALPAKDKRIESLTAKANLLVGDLMVTKGMAEQRRQINERKISRLESEVSSLKFHLEERNKHRLFLFVDTEERRSPFKMFDTWRSCVNLYYDEMEMPGDFDPPLASRIFILQAWIEVHFENRGAERATVRTMKAELLRKTSRGREKKIRLNKPLRLDICPVTVAPPSLDGYTVEGLTIMQPFILHLYCEMGLKVGPRLNQHCFLRLTMDVMNQPPYVVDIYPDWEESRAKGSVPIYSQNVASTPSS